MAHPFGKLSLELYYIYKITQNIADKLQMDLKLKVKKKKNLLLEENSGRYFYIKSGKDFLRFKESTKDEGK